MHSRRPRVISERIKRIHDINNKQDKTDSYEDISPISSPQHSLSENDYSPEFNPSSPYFSDFTPYSPTIENTYDSPIKKIQHKFKQKKAAAIQEKIKEYAMFLESQERSRTELVRIDAILSKKRREMAVWNKRKITEIYKIRFIRRADSLPIDASHLIFAEKVDHDELLGDV